jgi:phosphatidyl-myo-inositol alpha-mannosyltransferase
MVSYYLPSGSKIGVGHQVHALSNALVKRGHHVTVFSASGKSAGALYTTKVIDLPSRFRTFAFAFNLRNVDFSGFDILHAHGDDYWLWRRRTRGHIRTIHGSCFAESMRTKGFTGRLRMTALGLSEIVSTLVADRAVVVSDPTRHWYPWVRTVIPNGVDRSIFQPGESAAQPTILFVGTYERRKRGWLVRKQFDKVVRPALPNARLIMVCSDAPPGPAVEVTGAISLDRLAQLYREAWVLCLPSTYEGFGLPYAEAMSCGVPVVATPNAGARYVTRNGRDGLLRKPEEIGEAMLSVLTDEALRKHWSEAGLTRANDFDLAIIAERYEYEYRRLLHN